MGSSRNVVRFVLVAYSRTEHMTFLHVSANDLMLQFHLPNETFLLDAIRRAKYYYMILSNIFTLHI